MLLVCYSRFDWFLSQNPQNGIFTFFNISLAYLIKNTRELYNWTKKPIFDHIHMIKSRPNVGKIKHFFNFRAILLTDQGRKYFFDPHLDWFGYKFDWILCIDVCLNWLNQIYTGASWRKNCRSKNITKSINSTRVWLQISYFFSFFIFFFVFLSLTHTFICILWLSKC